MSKLYNHLLGILVIAFGLLVVLAIKISFHSYQEYQAGEKAIVQKNWKQSIVHYERAIKWYMPFSQAVQQSGERLWEIATVAEQRQDFRLALEAYRALRSALYAVESFYIPHRKWIPQCDERIASLMATLQKPQEPEQAAADKSRFLEMLQRDTSPHLGWSLVMEIGFLGWIGFTILLIWYAYNAAGELVWQRGVLWGSGIVLGFVLWIMGMLFA